MKSLLDIIKNFDYNSFGSVPKILLMAPTKIGDDIENKKYANYNNESAKNSKELAKEYEDLAKEFGCYFFDAGSVAEPSKIDYVHLMPEGHKAIAESLHKKILDILK